MLFLLRRYLPLLFLVGFSLFVFAPAIFGGLAFSGEEDIGFHYVISYYVDTALARGIPLAWIPSYFGGVPVSLDQFFGAWYPLNLALFTLFDFFTAHHLSMAIATAAGLLLSYAFGRAQEWTRASSLCLALFYFSATTYEWLWVGTNAAHSFAMLPGLLFALQYASVHRKYVLPILGGALALGIGFLAGFMQIVFYNFCIAGVYALFLDWSHYDKSIPFLRNIRISYTYTAITILGLGVGFFQFFPSAWLIDLTIRTNTYAIQNVTTAYPTEFITWFLPPLFSIPFFSGGGAAGFFITSIGIISAFLALRYYRTSTVLFFATLYAGILAFAFHLPVFSWLNEHIPPFSHMGGNFRWSVAASFPLAYIGAAGLEGLLRDPERITYRARRYIFAVTLAFPVLFVVGSIALGFLARNVFTPEIVDLLIEWYMSGRPLSFPYAHYTSVFAATLKEVTATFTLLNPYFLFGTLFMLLGSVFFYIAFFTKQSVRAISFIAVFLTAVIAAGTIVLQWDKFIPQSVILATKPELVRVIAERETDPHTYRIFGYLLGDGAYLQTIALSKPFPEEVMTMSMQTLINNTNVYFGIERMDGMEPYRTLRHNHLLNTVIAYDWAAWAFDDASPLLRTSALDQLYNRDVQRRVTIEEKLDDLPKRLPLLSMMNVKYVYSPFPLNDPSLTLMAELPIGVETVRYTLYLYENTRVLPRVYAAENPRNVDDERETFLNVVATKDFAENTWIECASCETEKGDAIVSVTKYDPGHVTIRVTAKRPTWVVFSESAFPGWHATIDGVEASIYTANYLFQAVNVPVGEHTLEFRYEDVAVGAVRSLFR